MVEKYQSIIKRLRLKPTNEEELKDTMDYIDALPALMNELDTEVRAGGRA